MIHMIQELFGQTLRPWRPAKHLQRYSYAGHLQCGIGN